MGNTHGYFTIDVEPFDTKPENFMVKATRKVEWHILPKIIPA
jgi:predicted HAD superfamily phosphohydrolase YqeG